MTFLILTSSSVPGVDKEGEKPKGQQEINEVEV